MRCRAPELHHVPPAEEPGLLRPAARRNRPRRRHGEGAPGAFEQAPLSRWCVSPSGPHAGLILRGTAVMRESIRVNPPIGAIAVEAFKDEIVGGKYKIPKGVPVSV